MLKDVYVLHCKQIETKQLCKFTIQSLPVMYTDFGKLKKMMNNIFIGNAYGLINFNIRAFWWTKFGYKAFSRGKIFS